MKRRTARRLAVASVVEMIVAANVGWYGSTIPGQHGNGITSLQGLCVLWGLIGFGGFLLSTSVTEGP